MILLNDIIAALKSRAVFFGGRIGGAAEVSAVEDDNFSDMPACYVIPIADDTSPNDSGHEIRQELTLTYTVVVVVSNQRHERGRQAYTEIEQARQSLWQALLNWQPRPNFEPLSYAGGQYVDMNRHRLIWQFHFETKTELGPEDGYQPDYPDFDHIEMEVDLQPESTPPPNPIYPTLNVKIKPMGDQ